MKKELAKIAFQKGGIFIENKKMKGDFISHSAVQFNIELLHLGYTLPEEAMYYIDEEYIRGEGKELLEYIHEFLGHYGSWKPFYPGFPLEVMNHSDAELKLFQMRHYMTGWTPDLVSEEIVGETHLSDDDFSGLCEEAKCLKIMNEEDIKKVYEGILEMNQSIPEKDKENLKSLINYGFVMEPESIPFKENLAIYVAYAGKKAIKYCNSITDILRGIMFFLGLGPTLELPKKRVKNGWGQWIDNADRISKRIPKIERRKRKTILALIEDYCFYGGNINKEDIYKYRNFWIKLGEKVHPGDYKNTYTFAYEIFRVSREDKIVTYNSRLHEAYKESQDKVLEILSERPGEFMRRLDSLYRRDGFSKTKTLNALVDLKNNPSTKVVLEYFNHVHRRGEHFVRRIKTPGSRSYFELPNLDPLDSEDIKLIKEYLEMLLVENYEKQESLAGKKVVISDSIKDVRLPKDMRTVSESLRVVARGTAFDFTGDRIRAYIYWRDTNGDMDLDLSASFLSEDLEISENISWNTGLKTSYACHSGDVRHVIGDCAEYIDIDINLAVERGFRYVCIDIHDYNGYGFNKYPNKAGICTVKNKIFLSPSTNWKPDGNTIQAFSLGTEGSAVLAMVIDLKEKKLYQIDEDLSGIPVGTYNSTQKKEMLKSYVGEQPISVERLIRLNTFARGGQILSEEEFNSIEDPVMEDYIFYKKEDILDNYSILKDLIE